MGYERYSRGADMQRGDNRQTAPDYGRDYGSGREHDYLRAHDQQADQSQRDRPYGQREYGNAGYQRGQQQDRANAGQYGQSRYYGGGDDDRSDTRRYMGGADRGDRDRGSGGYGQDRGGRDQGSYGRQPQGYDYDERGFMARAGDEVRSWFGDDEAERRRDADARQDERQYGERAGNDRDSDYHGWRRSQIAALDRDYDEYRNENRSKFETDFTTWRTARQGQRSSLSQVQEHMDVVGSDGSHVGTVDKVRGDRILLTKTDADAGGRHHSIPSRWIEAVDTKVTLAKTADEAKNHWRDEERNQAMFGDKSDDDTGRDAQGRMLNRSFSGTY